MSTDNTPDIDLTIFRCTEAAREDFEMCFHVYSHSGYRSTARYFYTGYGDGDVPDCVTDCYDLSNVTRREARQFVIDTLVDEYTTAREVVADCREEYDGDWIDFATEQMDELDFIEVFDEDRRPSIGEFKYEIVSVAGYSQGDYAEVMIDTADWEDSSTAQKRIEQMCYDAPIFARIIIDGVEYDINELLVDDYEWDRDTVADLITQEYGELWGTDTLNHTIELLPEYPEYS